MGLWIVGNRLLLIKAEDIHWVTINGKHIPFKGSVPKDKRRIDITPSTRIRMTLKRIENKIRPAKVEHGYIVDRRGSVIWHGVGTKDSIDVTDAIEKGILKGNIFTHNHPKGTSFSSSDFELLVTQKIHQLRISSTKYNYIISLPVGFNYSNWSIAEIFNTYNYILFDVKERMNKAISEGKIKSQFAELHIPHIVLLRMRKMVGIKYKRRQRSE